MRNFKCRECTHVVMRPDDAPRFLDRDRCAICQLAHVLRKEEHGCIDAGCEYCDKERRPEDDSQIVIEYTAARCPQGGWRPIVRKNGIELHSDMGEPGTDKATALLMAARDAHAEAAHYCGDWHVTIVCNPFEYREESRCA